MAHSPPARVLLLLLAATALAARGNPLEDELGRSEVRIWSEAYPIVEGLTIAEMRLPERLERLGYERVTRRPEHPGEWFWGNERAWIYRHAHRLAGEDQDAKLIGLALRNGDGLVVAGLTPEGRLYALTARDALWLEPELLSESLEGDRAVRRRVDLDRLPEHAWRALLAAEDHRFFEHPGVDARSIARALLADISKGGVAEGGSTITQQLIKNRDLTPKRTLGRKLSEAVRALALETEYDKHDILEAYLNTVYYGHVDGLAVHGIGTAARAYFGKPATQLSLAESATLAAIIQGPNRLSPIDHADAAKERRDWVLARMEELGWASATDVAAAKRMPVRTRETPPGPPPARAFVRWVGDVAEQLAPRRIEQGRGVVAETSLDPELQDVAEDVVRDWLDELRDAHPRLRGEKLQAALVAMDVETGGILAHVGGDPAQSEDRFDRVRLARRQPGSAMKPFVLLEAFDTCGSQDALTPATRVLDAPLSLAVPEGTWRPENADDRFRGVVDLRTTLVDSLNIPTVRVARWCGFDATARRLRQVGFDVPEDAPPSMALGALETTPLALCRAITVFATPGVVVDPRPAYRLERPGGRGLENVARQAHRVASDSAAYLVDDCLRDAVVRGTGRAAHLERASARGKTGTTSHERDAWFAGHAGSVACVVWIGLDGADPLGLSGAEAAAPAWQRFMQVAALARPPREVPRPDDLVVRWVDDETGRLVGDNRDGAHAEVFRRSALPDSKRWWRIDDPLPPIE
jgi:penicillin-binding protein 1B